MNNTINEKTENIKINLDNNGFPTGNIVRDTNMNEEEHKSRHIQLHKALDELFADSIENGELDINSTILQLIKWSYEQTKNPTKKD